MKETDIAARKSTGSKRNKAIKPAKAAPRKVVAKKAVKVRAKTAKKTARASRGYGEGNYKASRRFRTAEERFIKANRKKIPALGKAAEDALLGPEGAELKGALRPGPPARSWRTGTPARRDRSLRSEEPPKRFQAARIVVVRSARGKQDCRDQARRPAARRRRAAPRSPTGTDHRRRCVRETLSHQRRTTVWRQRRCPLCRKRHGRSRCVRRRACPGTGQAPVRDPCGSRSPPS